MRWVLCVGGCWSRWVVEMLGADIHHAIVWPQGEGGGGSHVLRAGCDGSFSRASEGSLEGGGFGGEGIHDPLSGGNVRR